MNLYFPNEKNQVLRFIFLILILGLLVSYISFLVFNSIAIATIICNVIYGSFIWELKIPDEDRPDLAKPIKVSNIIDLVKAFVYLNLYGIGFIYVFICSVLLMLKESFKHFRSL